MKSKIRTLFISLLFVFIGQLMLYGQKTGVYLNPDAEFRDAVDLFSKEKYGAAREKFLNVIRLVPDNSAELNARSEYYMAMCGIELFNGDAEYLVVNYIRNHPEHTRINKAWFELSRYHFKKKQYAVACGVFDKIDVYKLSEQEKDEYNFKYGYCTFMLDDYTKAARLFYEVKDKEDSKYASGATYYFAHIEYTLKKYETALKAFKKLENDAVYSRFVPYYISQIYFIQEKYDELLAYAPPLLDSDETKRTPEIARMLAEACFRKQLYEKTIRYMDIYFEKSPASISRDDNYLMGFSYYKNNEKDNAIVWLKKVNTDADDLMSQSALYYIGDCYNKNDEKIKAISYFNMAGRMTADKELQENALFSYAKLTYETSYNPYNEALLAFHNFIDKYPDSPNSDEALGYMSDLYLSTKNYKDAITSLEKIKKRDTRLNLAYQKVSLFRGIELFNNSLYKDAIEHFEKSLKFPLEQSIAALAIYWRGEAYYRLKNWDMALADYNLFLATSGASSLPEFIRANYNAGYCFFNKKQYPSALVSFRKYLLNTSGEPPALINDAYLRTGDCFFMNKDYNSAIDYYDKSIKMALADRDYAMYQKAISYGPLGKFETKATMLSEFTEKFPQSSYIDDAMYEAARTYQNMGNNSKAIALYDRLILDYPKSAFVSKSLLRKGLIFYNEGRDEQALESLKKVVTDFRGSEESNDALKTIRNVYVDMDKVEEFFVYVQSLGEDLADDVQDSLTYMAVENRYMANDCEGSVAGFNEYIERYPKGQFVTDANFYKAECEYRSGKFEEAMKGYAYVCSVPYCKYTETSLKKAAEINYNERNYEKAIELYIRLGDKAEYKENILLSKIGKMRCNYYLSDYEKAVIASRELLATDKLSEELIAEAHLTIGRSAMAMDSISLAVAEFSVLNRMTKSEMGAEAKWNLAYIQYVLGNYEESEKIAFELINQVPSYDYWIARSFILLADNYVKTGNLRQAKYTLQSIIENYEGADLIKVAQDRYNQILEEEKRLELLQQQIDEQNNIDSDQDAPDFDNN